MKLTKTATILMDRYLLFNDGNCMEIILCINPPSFFQSLKGRKPLIEIRKEAAGMDPAILFHKDGVTKSIDRIDFVLILLRFCQFQPMESVNIRVCFL